MHQFTKHEFANAPNVLAGRTYNLSNFISGPYFHKLLREGSPSKRHPGAKKTGVQAQCCSVLNQELKAICYHGSGDVFIIPTDKIHQDIKNRNAYFYGDAYTTLDYYRPNQVEGALQPKITVGRVMDARKEKKQRKNLYGIAKQLASKSKKTHITEIMADLDGHMLAANYYKVPTKRVKRNVFAPVYSEIVRCKLDCLQIRQFYKLNGLDIDAIPILYLEGNEEFKRDKFLEKESFAGYLEKAISTDCQGFTEDVLEQTLKETLLRFFFTGKRGTDTEKFYTNEVIEDYVFKELKTQLLASEDIMPELKAKMVNSFNSVEEELKAAKKNSESYNNFRKRLDSIYAISSYLSQNKLDLGLHQFELVPFIGPNNEARVTDYNKIVFRAKDTGQEYEIRFPVRACNNAFSPFALKKFQQEYSDPSLTLNDLSIKAKPGLYKVDSNARPRRCEKITDPSELEQVSTEILNEIAVQLNNFQPNGREAKEEGQIKHDIMELIEEGHNYYKVSMNSPDPSSESDPDDPSNLEMKPGC